MYEKTKDMIIRRVLRLFPFFKEEINAEICEYFFYSVIIIR